MNIREALMTQGPSLELHRAAQFEIARLDGVIEELRQQLANNQTYGRAALTSRAEAVAAVHAQRAAMADICCRCNMALPDGCDGLLADEKQCLRAQHAAAMAGDDALRSYTGNPAPGGSS